jgi:lipoprotein-releasing system ATP-binding protein
MTILEARQLSCTYPGKVHALQNVSLAVQPGESVSIMGHSGAGKSTLLHLLAGLQEATHGQVFWDSACLSTLSSARRDQWRSHSMGFVFQSSHLLADFSAIENVALAARIAGISRPAALARAKGMLERVGLAHRLHHCPGELSGGERQRVGLARAMVHAPAIVLADEPTGHLDDRMAREVWELLDALRHDHQTALVVVTHDQRIGQKADRCLWLSEGQLVAGPAGSGPVGARGTSLERVA